MGQFDQAPFPMTHEDVEDLIEAIQPTNVYVDLPVSIPVNGWSNSSPYVYTYTNSKITAECGIEVDFLANSENTDVMYLEYEKVAGGVQFTAPKKPTVAIPVNIRVINADAEAFESISADMVSTNAVPGAANAEQALSTLNSKIDKFYTEIRTWESNANGYVLLGHSSAQVVACRTTSINAVCIPYRSITYGNGVYITDPDHNAIRNTEVELQTTYMNL